MEFNGLLKRKTNAFFSASGDVVLSDIATAKNDLATGGSFDTHNNLSESGFATPIGAGDHSKGAWFDSQRNLVQNFLFGLLNFVTDVF